MDIAISKFFESIRNPFLDVIAKGFSLLGEPIFMVVLICAAYWLIDKKLGERLAVVTFTSMIFNAVLKGSVKRLRPYAASHVTRVPSEGLVDTMSLTNDASFPSGHSQISAGVTMGTATHYNITWVWITAMVLTLGVMWSRIYLGVHYFTDTLTGAALGIFFACLWDLLYARLASTKYWIIAGFAVVSIVFMILVPDKAMFEHAGMLIAGAIALPIEEKFIGFENATSRKNLVYRFLIGAGCVGLVFGLFSFLPFEFLDLIAWKFVKYFCTVLTGVLLVPYLFKKAKV